MTTKFMLAALLLLACHESAWARCREICGFTMVFGGRCPAKVIACDIIPVTETYKLKTLHDGEAIVVMLADGDPLAIDRDSATAGSIPDPYKLPFDRFQTCLVAAKSLEESVLCLDTLKAEAMKVG